MPKPRPTPDVKSQSEAALLSELRGLRADLGPMKGRMSGMYARRLEVFAELDGRGIDHAVIGEAFGVTAAAVGVALHKQRGQDGNAK